MLACLSAGAAHANPAPIGGLESRLESIPGNQFSTTTKLSGEVLFGLGDTLGGSSSAEGVLFSERARLNFSTSFTGEDSLRTRLEGWETSVSGGIGATDNQTENLYDGDSSLFYTGGVRVLYGNQVGPFTYAAGLGAGVTKYDEEVMRDGDDSWIGDFEGSLAMFREFSKSFTIGSHLRGYYGGHKDITRRFAHSGVYYEDYFWWSSQSTANYRFDHQALGGQGLELATEFFSNGIRHSESDDVDSTSFGFRQEGRYNFANGATVFIEGGYGRRTWDDWDDLDSDWFRLGGGVRGDLGGNIQGEIKGGFEWRDYDEDMLNDDENDEAYVEGSVTGQWDQVAVGVYAKYGIQEFLGEDFWGIDPVGIRGGLRAVYAFNERTRFTSDCNYTTFEYSDVYLDTPSDHWLRLSGGVGIEHDFHDRLTIGAGGSVVLLDDDNEDDTYFVGSIRSTFRF